MAEAMGLIFLLFQPERWLLGYHSMYNSRIIGLLYPSLCPIYFLIRVQLINLWQYTNGKIMVQSYKVLARPIFGTRIISTSNNCFNKGRAQMLIDIQ